MFPSVVRLEGAGFKYHRAVWRWMASVKGAYQLASTQQVHLCTSFAQPTNVNVGMHSGHLRVGVEEETSALYFWGLKRKQFEDMLSQR